VVAKLSDPRDPRRQLSDLVFFHYSCCEPTSNIEVNSRITSQRFATVFSLVMDTPDQI